MSSDDAVEEVTVDPAKVTVNRRQRTLDECPAVLVVVLDIGVVVVQVGNGN